MVLAIEKIPRPKLDHDTLRARWEEIAEELSELWDSDANLSFMRKELTIEAATLIVALHGQNYSRLREIQELSAEVTRLRALLGGIVRDCDRILEQSGAPKTYETSKVPIICGLPDSAETSHS